MNIDEVKKEFPMLLSDTQTVYLDTAATSLTPKCVIDAITDYYASSRASVHRGLYESAIRVTDLYDTVRQGVAGFIGAKQDEVIFTGGATLSSNMAINMIEQAGLVGKDDEILVSSMEHHAVFVPLKRLAERVGAKFVVVPLSQEGSVSKDDILERMNDSTKIVAIMGASNVTGRIIDVAPIFCEARRKGVLSICDMTALVGHVPVNVSDIAADIGFFSGHKMCGPTGIGVLWVRKELLDTFEPAITGGGIVAHVDSEHIEWVDGVERFEAGTPNIAGVLGLGRAVQFLSKIGLGEIHTHVAQLVDHAHTELAKISEVRLLSERESANNVGIVSFTIDGVHPHDVSQVLADAGVALRAGHHCAEPLHGALEIGSSVRASMYLYNTAEDVDKLVAGVQGVVKLFHKK